MKAKFRKILASILVFASVVGIGAVAYSKSNQDTVMAADSDDSVAYVSTFEDLQTKLADDEIQTVIVNNSIYISGTVTIDGQGKTIQVAKPYIDSYGVMSTSGYSRYCALITNSGSNVLLKNVTIYGGNCGDGTTYAGGVMNRGTLRMENVTVSRSNRGVCNNGYCTMVGCNIVRNAATYGGGIYNAPRCSLIMDSCSLSENRSVNPGCGGGAIESNNAALLYMNNTVIANNSSSEVGGAINNVRGSLYMLNCTVTGNVTTAGLNHGGGIGNQGGNFYAANCLIANNKYSANGIGTPQESDVAQTASGANTYMYNCVYGEIRGSIAAKVVENCKKTTDNLSTSATRIFPSYRNDGVFKGTSGKTIGFAHSILTALPTNRSSLYAPAYKYGAAANGGVETYVDFSDWSNIKMSYKNAEGVETALANGVSTGGTKVSRYMEGEVRVDGIIGASQITDKVYYTVILDLNFDKTHSVVQGATTYGDSYLADETVTVKAFPSKGYVVDHWEITDDNGNTTNVDGDENGNFVTKIKYNFTIKPIIAQKISVEFYSYTGGVLATYNYTSATVKNLSVPTTTPMTNDYEYDNQGNITKKWMDYEYLGWYCYQDGKTYTDAQIKAMKSSDVAGVLKFIESYKVKYYQELEFTMTADKSSTVIASNNTSETVTVTYAITSNCGFNSILLIPEYDQNVFCVEDVQTNNGTVLGTATITDGYVDPDDGLTKIVWEKGPDQLTSLEPTFLTITYRVINAKDGTYDFGLVLDYDSIPLKHNVRSEAYVWREGTQLGNQTEVKIIEKKVAHFTIATIKSGVIAVEESVSFTYDQNPATTYGVTSGSGSTPYESLASYTNTPNGDHEVAYAYNGTGTIHVKWYDVNGNELPSAPTHAGTYYVGVSADASADGEYSATNEVRKAFTINKNPITYTISQYSSIYYIEDIKDISNAGALGTGVVYSGDVLGVSYSTTATKTSAVGDYPINLSWSNNDYDITYVPGTYKILPLNVNIKALDQTAQFTGNEPAVDQTKYAFTYKYNDVDYTLPQLLANEITSVTLTKASGVNVGKYTITPSSVGGSNFSISYTNGVFTITSSNSSIVKIMNFFDGDDVIYKSDNYDLLITNFEDNPTDPLEIWVKGKYESNPMDMTITNNIQTNADTYIITVSVNFTEQEALNYIGLEKFTGSSFSGDTYYYEMTPVNQIQPGVTVYYRLTDGVFNISNDFQDGVLYIMSGTPATTYDSTKVYGCTVKDATFTVTGVIHPMAITLEAENKTKVYGATPTATLTWNLTNGTIYDNEVVPALDTYNGSTQTTIAKSTPVGDYAIKFNDDVNSIAYQNYAITYVDAIYSVTKAAAADITISNDIEDVDYKVIETLNPVIKANDYELENLVFGTDYYFEYSVDGINYDNRDNFLNAYSSLDAGLYCVKVTLNGNDNYEGSSFVTTFNVNKVDIDYTLDYSVTYEVSWEAPTKDENGNAIDSGISFVYAVGNTGAADDAKGSFTTAASFFNADGSAMSYTDVEVNADGGNDSRVQFTDTTFTPKAKTSDTAIYYFYIVPSDSTNYNGVYNQMKRVYAVSFVDQDHSAKALDPTVTKTIDSSAVTFWNDRNTDNYAVQNNYAFTNQIVSNPCDAYTFSLDGYNWVGWSSSDASYTEIFNASQTVLTIANDDVVLYAWWDRVSFNVMWYNYDGTLMHTSSCYDGSTVTFTGTLPTRAKDIYYTYNFAGWLRAEFVETTLNTQNSNYTFEIDDVKYTISGSATADFGYSIVDKDGNDVSVAMNDDNKLFEFKIGNDVYQVAGDGTTGYSISHYVTTDYLSQSSVEDSVYTYTANPEIEAATSYIAAFSMTPTLYSITYYMISYTDNTISQYEDVQYVGYNTTIEYLGIDPVTWFKSDIWYTEPSMAANVKAPVKMPAEDIEVYGTYKLDIGNGDVNADGLVNTDDITIYRRWIVGGYDIIDVEAGTEWALVHSASFDINNNYFLKAVYDVNSDLSADIRDISTIRMALVGGYTWLVLTGVHVTGQEVGKDIGIVEVYNFVDLCEALSHGYRVRLMADITDTSNTGNLQVITNGQIYLDLNGHDLTCTSVYLYTESEDSNIVILSGGTGTISTTDGTTIKAKDGEVELEDIEIRDAQGEINLEAHPLILSDNVGLYRGSTGTLGADITVPDGTEIKIDKYADITIGKVIVENNAQNKTGTVTIENASDDSIVVKGNVDKLNYFDNVTTDPAGNYKVKKLASSDNGLANALVAGGAITVVDDIKSDDVLFANTNANIDLNGNVVDGKLVISEIGAATGPTVTLSDSEGTGKWTFDTDKTIDSNGNIQDFPENYQGCYTIVITGHGKLLVDGVVVENRKDLIGAIYADENSVVTVKNGGYVYGAGQLGIFVAEATLYVYDGKIEGVNNSAIQTLGGNTTSKIYLYEGAEVVCTKHNAIYLPAGYLYIEDAVVTGRTAIYAKGAGTNGSTPITPNVEIRSGTFTANGNPSDPDDVTQAYVHSSDDAYPTGDAIVVEACNFANKGNPSVRITGGSFISAYGLGIGYYQYGSNSSNITITGGTYSTIPDTDLIAMGYSIRANVNGTYTVE